MKLTKPMKRNSYNYQLQETSSNTNGISWLFYSLHTGVDTVKHRLNINIQCSYTNTKYKEHNNIYPPSPQTHSLTHTHTTHTELNITHRKTPTTFTYTHCVRMAGQPKQLREASRTFAIRHSMANVKVWHSMCELILPFKFSCSFFEDGGVMMDF